MGNRHDIYIWDAAQHPEPESLQQAADLAFDLVTKDSVVNPHFVTLIQKTKAYIQQQDAEVQNAYEDIGHELEKNTKACLMLSLPEYGAELGLRFIVQIAMALNLGVYDHEMRLVFLPPNIVLPIGAFEYWDALCESLDKLDFPLNESDFTKWFNPLFEKMIARHTFNRKIRDSSKDRREFYVRDVSLGQQQIWISYSKAKYRGEFRPNIAYSILCAEAEKIYSLFSFYRGMIYTFQSYTSAYSLLKCNINSYTTSLQYLVLAEAEIFNFLDVASNIIGLDQYMNGNINENFTKEMIGFYNPLRLIIARLANNPHFEQLIIEFEKNADWGANQAARVTEWPKLVKYLREEVKPLV